MKQIIFLVFKIVMTEFRLKATEYDDLRGKLQANIENVKNIVVRQSLSELFLDDFRRHIAQNPKYRLPLNQHV
jgi:ribosomal protein S3AE